MHSDQKDNETTTLNHTKSKGKTGLERPNFSFVGAEGIGWAGGRGGGGEGPFVSFCRYLSTGAGSRGITRPNTLLPTIIFTVSFESRSCQQRSMRKDVILLVGYHPVKIPHCCRAISVVFMVPLQDNVNAKRGRSASRHKNEK